MKPLAIVTSWFGKDLTGGAEQQAWQIATRLAIAEHEVEVLTTCCNSFFDDWGVNHKKPGVSKHSVSENKTIKIRRFKVDKRDSESFNRVNSSMLKFTSTELKPGINPISDHEAAIFCQENINSSQLLDFLRSHHQDYSAFLFLPYLYGVILNGLPIVRERAFLQPCLHNEVYAYLPQVAEIFHQAKGLLFNSEGEAQLANKLYGAGIISKSYVVGEGVEVNLDYNKSIDYVNDFALNKERFILYLGRRDATKNTDFLVKCYAAFKEKYPYSKLKLVLAGSGTVSFNNDVDGLKDLGFVSEGDKTALLSRCLALFQPSKNESYSRVIMEAWFYSKPVIAHQDCLATAMAVKKSGGGWLAQTEQDWVEMFVKMDGIANEFVKNAGVKGQAYARENAVWDKVIQRYETRMELFEKPINVIHKPTTKIKEIHQLLAGFTCGDAISNQAREIQKYLQSLGYKSKIFAEHLDPIAANEAEKFTLRSVSPLSGLIYHHSIGCKATNFAIEHKQAKCLIYHNITPAHFFAPYRPEISQLLEQGRSDLSKLAQHFPLSCADSSYNATELVAAGFNQPKVLPIIVRPDKWDMVADAQLMKQLQDGKTNLLFVGRFSPNKLQNHLLEAFKHYLSMDSQARLILVGGFDAKDPYYHHILNTMQSLKINDYVIIPGKISDAQLSAFYRTAHLFWSMSEHEGFCVPLVEAMWFDVPILAYKSSAIPETLGEAGLMFNTKNDLVKVAALAKLVVKDEQLRGKVIAAQRKRRESFLPSAVKKKIDDLITNLVDKY